ncbi:MAG: hypothetical protein QM724_10950 [Flavobacteriales bacterium]
MRRLKEAHVQQAGRVLADAEQQYAAQESRRMEDAALAAANAGGNLPPLTDAGAQLPPTPHNDGYVTLAHNSEQIYESLMEHRSAKVSGAVAEKDRDMQRMTALEETIDSLEAVLDETPRGKKWDKLRARADRAIDDHLIMRTELGQRLSYITREEYKAAKDSADVLRSAIARKGLAPGEPLVQMAQRLEEDARAGIDLAGTRRKEADRSENIVLRDSLYRQAYAMELQALRNMDRALTVRNHILSDKFKAGSAPSYVEIERSMFGMPDELAWDRRAQGSVADSDTSHAAKAASLTEGTSAAQGSVSGPGDATQGASTAASQAQQQAEQAYALEQRSITAADRANAVQDSAATAERRERQAIEREAARLRHISDSLHAAAVVGQRTAQEMEEQQRDAAEKAAFAERLRKYYYLTGEEQVAVMNADDQSRYFTIAAKAKDQRAEAEAAKTEAGHAHVLADALAQQASTLRGDSSAAGRDERADRLRHLDERTGQLRSRADSLNQRADLLDRAASVNESQAALVLQSLSPDRSSAIMALEQRTRRNEPTLVQAPPALRPPAAGTQDSPAAAGTSADQRNRANAPSSDRTATINASVPPTSAAARPSAPPTRTMPSSVSAAPGGLPATLPALTKDEFSMDAGGASQGAIPIDAPMPAGVVFKVQVGAFKHAPSDQAFSGMTPVTGETAGNGLTRYTAGAFTNAASAAKASEQVRARGYRDAFVVAYQDGKRIPVAQAMALTGAIAAQPAAAAAPHPASTVAPASELPNINAAGAEDATVLSNYASSAQEVLAAFQPSVEATAYYNDPAAAPANQVEAIKGLFFTVQVGVYSKPTALDKLFNITPLNSERTETNKIRYTTGVFLDLESARVRKDGTVALGVKDAFITAYLNGKRIPMRDARALLAKFGVSILADPSALKR